MPREKFACVGLVLVRIEPWLFFKNYFAVLRRTIKLHFIDPSYAKMAAFIQKFKEFGIPNEGKEAILNSNKIII